MPPASPARPNSTTADRATVRMPRRAAGPSAFRWDASLSGGREPVGGVFVVEGPPTPSATLRIRAPAVCDHTGSRRTGIRGLEARWSDQGSRRGQEVERQVEAAGSAAMASATPRAVPDRCRSILSVGPPGTRRHRRSRHAWRCHLSQS
jgi:hypothetical protein